MRHKTSGSYVLTKELRRWWERNNSEEKKKVQKLANKNKRAVMLIKVGMKRGYGLKYKDYHSFDVLTFSGRDLELRHFPRLGFCWDTNYKTLLYSSVYFVRLLLAILQISSSIFRKT